MTKIEQQLRQREVGLIDYHQSFQPIGPQHRIAGKGASVVANRLLHRFAETGTREFAGLEDCANNVTLVDICHDYAGRIDLQVTALLEVPIYFREVQSFLRSETRYLNERLLIAQQSGFLIMGKDEAIAVILEKPNDMGRTLVAAFRTDSEGRAYVLDGVSTWNISLYQTQRCIADLNANRVDSEIESLVAENLREMSRPTPCQTHIARLQQSVDLIERHRENAKPERTSAGSVIHRLNDQEPSAVYQMAPLAAGWIRYPTHQDAWYFSVRVNPQKREVLTFAEGDISHIQCDDMRQFWGELKGMADWYGKSRTPSAVGYELDGARTEFYDTLYLLQGETAECRLEADATSDASALANSPGLFLAAAKDHPVWTQVSEAEREVPADAFQLDLLNPLAYEAHTCLARQVASGFELQVTLHNGTVCKGTVALDMTEGPRSAEPSTEEKPLLVD